MDLRYTTVQRWCIVILVVFFRTIILYLLVILVMRLMGKRQIGQLQPYELVVAIMISDLASVPMQNTGIPLASGIIPILTILIAQIIISFIVFRSNRARKTISGSPVTMIKEGRIIEKNLRRELFTLNDLVEAVRMEGYSDLSEVQEAILETNGELSVYGYDSEPVPYNIILDGRVISQNMEIAGITEKDLEQEIKSQGANAVSQVLICCYFESGKWYTQLKEDKNQS